MLTLSEIRVVLRAEAFMKNVEQRYRKVLADKLDKSVYHNDEHLDRFGRLTVYGTGKVGERSPADVMRFCGFRVVNVANDPKYACDYLVQDVTLDMKTARQVCGSYTLRHTDPAKAQVVFGSGLSPDELLVTTFEPKKVPLRLDKGGQAEIVLSSAKDNYWIKNHGGSLRDAMLLLRDIVGIDKDKEATFDAAINSDLEGLFRASVKKHSKDFPVAEDSETLHNVLRLLNGTHVSKPAELAFLDTLVEDNWKARKAVGAEQGALGDTIVEQLNRPSVVFEVKVCAALGSVSYGNISDTAKFDYMVAFYFGKHQQFMYILPRSVVRDRSIDGIAQWSANKDNHFFNIPLKSANNENHQLYQYRYSIADGLEHIDGILKGSV